MHYVENPVICLRFPNAASWTWAFRLSPNFTYNLALRPLIVTTFASVHYLTPRISACLHVVVLYFSFASAYGFLCDFCSRSSSQLCWRNCVGASRQNNSAFHLVLAVADQIWASHHYRKRWNTDSLWRSQRTRQYSRDISACSARCVLVTRGFLCRHGSLCSSQLCLSSQLRHASGFCGIIHAGRGGVSKSDRLLRSKPRE